MDNSEDQYALAIRKDEDIIGDIPRKISFLCSLFIRRGGIIHSLITGDRRYSHHLPQGGIEVPCRFVFSGVEKDLNKVKMHLEDCNMKVVSRPSSYVCMGHVKEENMKSLEVKQEPLDVDDNQTSSTVYILQLSRSTSTASVTRKRKVVHQ